MQEKVGRRLPDVPFAVLRDERERANRLLDKLTAAQRTLSNVERRIFSQALGGFFEVRRLENDTKLRARVGEEEYSAIIERAEVHLLIIEGIWDVLKPQDNLRVRLSQSWDTHLYVESQIREERTV